MGKEAGTQTLRDPPFASYQDGAFPIAPPPPLTDLLPSKALQLLPASFQQETSTREKAKDHRMKARQAWSLQSLQPLRTMQCFHQ